MTADPLGSPSVWYRCGVFPPPVVLLLGVYTALLIDPPAPDANYACPLGCSNATIKFTGFGGAFNTRKLDPEGHPNLPK